MRTVLKKSGRLGKANCDAVIRVCDQVGNHSQLSIRLVEQNRAFEIAGRTENANLAGAKTCAAFSVIDCLTLVRENRLNAANSK